MDAYPDAHPVQPAWDEPLFHAKVRKLSWPLLPPSYERQLGHAERIELADDRRIRERNKPGYRLAHWPIWIWVFFIAPGPLTFDLFESGFDLRMTLWLGAVLLGTGIAGLRGQACPASSRGRTSFDSPRIGRTRSIAASATRSRGAK